MTMWIIYLIGVIVALLAARLLKNTVFKGDGEVYLMELPPYRMPTLRSLVMHMWDRGKMYLQKAGTIILATSILLYVANTYPEKENFSKDYDAQIELAQKSGSIGEHELKVLAVNNLLAEEQLAEIKAEKTISDEMAESLADKEMNDAQKAIVEKVQKAKESVAALENEKSAEAMEYTVSGRVGKFLEPFFRPIGFDWKLTTASIGALAAKEVFVSQLGILYAEGEADEESVPLREQLAKNYTPLQAFCIMLFCLLSIPCFATLAVIKRELNSWTAAGAEMAALFVLAYAFTFLVYQGGTLLGIGTKLIGG